MLDSITRYLPLMSRIIILDKEFRLSIINARYIIMQQNDRITIQIINPNTEVDTVRYIREIICASNAIKAESNSK